MSRGPSQRITDVLVAIERCQRCVTVLGDDAGADLVGMAEDAIERNLQIIGEAVNHLPVEIVRDVVETHLPPLAEALRGHAADE